MQVNNFKNAPLKGRFFITGTAAMPTIRIFKPTIQTHEKDFFITGQY